MVKDETHSVLFKATYEQEEFSRYSDWLRVGRNGDRIPVGARFSPPVRTGPGAQPASSVMVKGEFPGVKRSGRGAKYPHSPSSELRIEMYLYSRSGLSWSVLGWAIPLPLPLRANRIWNRMPANNTLWLTIWSSVATLCTTMCNIYKFCFLPTHCSYVFCVDLRTNSYYFPVQH